MSVLTDIPSAFCLQLVSRRGLSQLPVLPKVHVMITVADFSEKKIALTHLLWKYWY